MNCTTRLVKHNFYVSRLCLIYCSAAFFAFLGGVSIYAFFRNLDIVLFQFFPKPSFLESLHFPVRADSVLMSFFLYNLPHGLWCLSGLLVIRAVWLTNQKWRAIYCGLFISAISFLEISQLSESLPGTFDVLDLTSYSASAFTESIIYNFFVKRKERKR